jgi:serine O-acetyltransferase
MSGREPKRHQDLEDVIDVIAASYDSDDEINNLDSADLPNKRAVITAFNHIMPVLYMGFYSTRALNRTNLRYAISEHLYPAQDILVEQIDRAVRYQERMGRLAEKKPEGWSEEVVLRLLEKIPELRRVLNTDVRAAYDGDPAASSIEEVVFSYPSVQAITAYRVSTPTANPASTSTPAPRLAKASSSTTARGWSSAQPPSSAATSSYIKALPWVP